jgi:hypothetical protein
LVVRIRGRLPGAFLFVVLACTFVLTGCVPDPTNRPSSSADGSLTTPAPTPLATPAGPTPTPSFVRPTPTPQPSFLVYVVVPGDRLVTIAKRHGTTGQSVAYWNRARYPSLDPDSAAYRPDYLLVGWTLVLIPNAVVDPEDLPPPAPSPTPSDEAEESEASPAG